MFGPKFKFALDSGVSVRVRLSSVLFFFDSGIKFAFMF